MVLLDTNVLSELMRDMPEPRVLAFLDAMPEGVAFTSAVTEAELRLGLALLPEGQRRARLTAAAEHVLARFFPGRILPFDSAAARTYAAIRASRSRAGRPISHADAQIAAIAATAGLTLLTRNVRDFAGTGVMLRDPWA